MRPIKAHEGSVFTLCILKCGALLSGGGKDRKIIRWSADLAPERECEVICSCVCLCYIRCVKHPPHGRKMPGMLELTGTLCPDSRKVWGCPHRCSCGWWGSFGWYNPKCNPQRIFLWWVCCHSSGMLIICLFLLLCLHTWGKWTKQFRSAVTAAGGKKF